MLFLIELPIYCQSKLTSLLQANGFFFFSSLFQHVSPHFPVLNAGTALFVMLLAFLPPPAAISVYVFLSLYTSCYFSGRLSSTPQLLSARAVMVS